jgi:hypothetical protein
VLVAALGGAAPSDGYEGDPRAFLTATSHRVTVPAALDLACLEPDRSGCAQQSFIARPLPGRIPVHAFGAVTVEHSARAESGGAVVTDGSFTPSAPWAPVGVTRLDSSGRRFLLQPFWVPRGADRIVMFFRYPPEQGATEWQIGIVEHVHPTAHELAARRRLDLRAGSQLLAAAVRRDCAEPADEPAPRPCERIVRDTPRRPVARLRGGELLRLRAGIDAVSISGSAHRSETARLFARLPSRGSRRSYSARVPRRLPARGLLRFRATYSAAEFVEFQVRFARVR